MRDHATDSDDSDDLTKAEKTSEPLPQADAQNVEPLKNAELDDGLLTNDSLNNKDDKNLQSAFDEPITTPYPRTSEKKQKNKALLKNIIMALILLLILAIVAYGLFKDDPAVLSKTLTKPFGKSSHQSSQTITLQGQMQLQQTSIAAKVPGRIAQILVTEGDMVKKGQQLIEMDSPEINAKISQAEAGKKAAQSQLDKANNGARPQEIAQAKAAWLAHKAASDLAANTYERVNRLYEEGLMARQKRDEAYAQFIANQEQTEAARLQYELAQEGARSEDKDAASAQVAQVEGKLAEAMAAKEEANLKSPISGLVDTVIVNPGEVIGEGVPLLTLVDTDNQWLVLSVTERYLSQFAINQQFVGTIPALSTPDKPFTKTFTVFASSALADFATWRPTNNDDGFDVRTFEIKARPTEPDARIRSGMSVVVTITPNKAS